jgi:hypothetical protein
MHTDGRGDLPPQASGGEAGGVSRPPPPPRSGGSGCARSASRRGDDPGVDLDGEPAGADDGVPVLEGPGLVRPDPEEAGPADPPVRGPRRGAGGEQRPGVVEVREVGQVGVLQGVQGGAVERGRVVPQEQEDEGVPIEVHGSRDGGTGG